MATTSNYSWTTPDDTDLVKDGAAAIRTLGSAIDTTVFTNAGAAIQKSIVDAAGDLIYATADDTPARLAIGTAGQVLTVNSGATAPEWATPGGAAFIGCALTASADQSTTGGVDTAITFNTEDFDTDAFHDTSTNTSRITIPAGLGGKYLFTFNITDTGLSGAATSSPTLRKNGTKIVKTEGLFSSLDYRYMAGTHLLDLVATDYIEVYYNGSSNGTIKSYRAFSCQKVG